MCRSVDFSVDYIDQHQLRFYDFTNGSNGGALGTFSQLRNVMLLSHNKGFPEAYILKEFLSNNAMPIMQWMGAFFSGNHLWKNRLLVGFPS